MRNGRCGDAVGRGGRRAVGGAVGRAVAVALAMAAAVAGVGAPGPVEGAVPALVGYQGRLLRMDGTPEAGILPMTFSIVDAASGGTMLWTETQSVAFTDGFYSVLLGSVAALPATATDGANRFLAVSVMGEELAPRQPIVSVAFALRAGMADALAPSASGPGSGLDADSVDGLEASAFAAAGHTHVGVPTFYDASQTLDVTATGSGWVAVPGTSVTFSLPVASSVDLWAYGSITPSDNGAPAYTHCGFRFVVDGTGRGEPTWGDQIIGCDDGSGALGAWWCPWTIRRLETMGAGSHTVSLELTGWTGSPDGCVMPAQDYGRARMTITVR